MDVQSQIVCDSVAPAFNDYRYGFNGKEKDDEVKGSGNSMDFGGRIYDPRLGRWLSVDPLQAKYSQFSPYNFVVNCPIWLIDPDGLRVRISGQDAEATVAALQKKTSLTLVYDTKTKMLTATGNPKTALDKKLLAAIKDPDITVNLKTERGNTTTLKNTKKTGNLVIGGFDGSVQYTAKENGQDVKKVETSQYFNLKQAELEEKQGGNSAGTNGIHELVESYIGAVQSPGATGPVDNADDKNWAAYGKAHAGAVALDPAFKEGEGLIPDANGKIIGSDGKEITDKSHAYSVGGKNINVKLPEEKPK